MIIVLIRTTEFRSHSSPRPDTLEQRGAVEQAWHFFNSKAYLKIPPKVSVFVESRKLATTSTISIDSRYAAYSHGLCHDSSTRFSFFCPVTAHNFHEAGGWRNDLDRNSILPPKFIISSDVRSHEADSVRPVTAASPVGPGETKH
jgi:hypothetical protein